MDYNLESVKKLIGRLSKRHSYFYRFIGTEYCSDKNYNTEDAVIFLLCLLFNTGYVLPGRLSQVDWMLSGCDFINEGLLIDEVYDDSLDNYDDIEEYFNNNKTIQQYANRSSDELNNYLQLIRNSAAHSHLRICSDVHEIEFKIKNSKYLFKYDTLFMLFEQFMSYIVLNYFGKIDYYDIREIDIKDSYNETKEYYLEYFKDKSIYHFIVDYINKLNNMKYEDNDFIQLVYRDYSFDELTDDELAVILSKKGKIEEEDQWILNSELQVYLDGLLSDLKEFYDNKELIEEKFSEYGLVFDEIYKAFALGDSSHYYDNTIIISGYLDDICVYFNELNERLYHLNDDNIDKSYVILLFTIIFGLTSWDNVNLDNVDFSKVKIDKDFMNSKMINYNDDFVNLCNKYYEIKLSIDETMSNDKIPAHAKENIIGNKKVKMDRILNAIYELKNIKEGFTDSQNLLRHIRNAFCHGYYVFNNNIIKLEDYGVDKDGNKEKTFEATISIIDLLDIALDMNVLEQLYGDKKKTL